MTATKDLLKLAQATQAYTMVKENIKASKKKKKKLLGLGVKNIVGTNLIKVQADIAGGIK